MQTISSGLQGTGCADQCARAWNGRTTCTLLRLLIGAVLAAQSTQASSCTVVRPREGLRHKLQGHGRSLRADDAAPRPSRGILMVSHGVQLLSAYVNIRVMREDLHCKLPIEIVYFGAKEAPPAYIAAALKTLTDVQLIDGSIVPRKHLRPPPRAPKQTTEDKAPTGFHSKLYALIHVTSYDEVLMLDSDSLPLMNPETLFDTQEYTQHGNLFWPDFWHPYHPAARHPHLAVQPALYESLGLKPFWNATNYRQYRAAESGQFLFDRVRHRDVLSALWAFAWEYDVKKHAWGDKELYRLAFVYVNKSDAFQQVDIAPRAGAGVGVDYPTDKKLYGQGMIQSSPVDARPAFLHRTGTSKYVPHYVHNAWGSPGLERNFNGAILRYITAPMREEDANNVIGPWSWEPQHADTKAWETRDCSYKHTPSKYRNTSRYDVPELWCKRQEADKDRVAMYPIELFHDAHKYMLAAHLYMRDFVYHPTVT